MAADVYISIRSGVTIHSGSAVSLKGSGPVGVSGINVNTDTAYIETDWEGKAAIYDNRFNNKTYYI